MFRNPFARAARPVESPRPYAGGADPAGAFGVVPTNGEIVMDLPPGIVVQGILRVAGRPAGAYRSTNGIPSWDPQITIEVKPADEGTPRLLPVGGEHKREWVYLELRRKGWSEKAVVWFGVPEPGGRYRARLAGTPEDHEEHLVFTQRD